MPRVLTPDFDRTEQIDIRRYNAEALWQSMPESRDKPFEYEDEDDPVLIEIGFIPASVRTEINAMDAARLGHTSKQGLSATQFQAMYESARIAVAWGVRGHNIDNVPFITQPRELRGRSYELVDDSVIDIYERLDWILGLKAAIMDYNSLDTEKKRRS